MLHIVKFKGCRRCGGDLFLESDSEGVYISCLQCGANHVLRHADSREPAEKKRRKVAAR